MNEYRQWPRTPLRAWGWGLVLAGFGWAGQETAWAQPVVAVARDVSLLHVEALQSGNVIGFDSQGRRTPSNDWGMSSQLFEWGSEPSWGKWLPLNPNPLLNVSLAEDLSGVAYRDGSLYFSQSTMGMGEVIRVDPATGLATGRSSIAPSGMTPTGQIKAGPDGAVYMLLQRIPPLPPSPVDDLRDWSSIVRYDGDFVPYDPREEGWTVLANQVVGYDLEFLPGNRLAVSLWESDAVDVFDLAHGIVRNTLVLPGLGGLDTPRGLAYDHHGTLYVASAGNRQILRYDATTGAFLGGLDLLGFELLNEVLDLEFLDGEGGNTLLLSQRDSPHLVKISNLHGPGPAFAEPFGPGGGFLPQEKSLFLAVIPESFSGPTLAGMLIAMVAGLWYRRHLPGR